jgi:signal transduction histidine kinase
MTREARSLVLHLSRRAGVPIAWSLLAFGAVALAGQRLAPGPALGIITSPSEMSPVMALALALMGAALLLRHSPAHARGAHAAATVFALAVMGIGIVTTLDAGAGEVAERMRLLVAGDADAATRLPPTSGVALLLLGFAVAAMDVAGQRGWWPAQLAAAVAMMYPAVRLSSTLMIAEAGGLAAGGAPPALHTVAVFAALGIAVLLARPHGGIVEVALGTDFGGRAFRWMFVAAHLVPFTLMGLRLWGQRAGWFDSEQSIALTSGVTVFLLLATSWLVARRLDRTHRALRATERALEHSRQRLDIAVHAVGLGTFEWDLASGATAGDEMADRLWSFAPPDPRTVESHLARLGEADAGRLRQLLGDGGDCAVEHQLRVRVVDAGHGGRWLGLRGVVTRDGAGRAVRFEGVCWDADAEHEAEASRLRAQQRQLEQKDQFLSHASHELRSPLAAIYEFVGLLREGLAGPLNDEQREYADIALRNARELRAMIDDLLDMTRLDYGRISIAPRPTDLVAIVGDVVASLRAAADDSLITLWCDLPARAPQVLADPHRARQVLVNLVENALKFTPDGGTITVRVADRPEEGAVCVTVTDSGVGIPPEETGRIFEPLCQLEPATPRSRRGLGLGLAICRELVSRQGGRLWVESEVGAGSRFHFTLPVWSMAHALAPLVEDARASGGAGAVVHVDLVPLDPRPLGAQDQRAVAAVWRSLATRMSWERHALLPPCAHETGSLIIVSFAAPEELEGLVAALKSSLESGHEPKNIRLGHEVWVSPLHLDIGAPAGPAEAVAERMAELVVSAVTTEDPRRVAS